MAPQSPAPPPVLDDRTWHPSARLAAVCSLTFAALTFLVDWDAGTLTPPRAALWLTLSTALFLVLLPPHVTATPGRISVRGPLSRTVIDVGALTVVRQYSGPSAHLILRDVHGGRAELDPRVLKANPLLWHELDTGVRRSLERGTLREGAEIAVRLVDEIDGETARAVLRASGLE